MNPFGHTNHRAERAFWLGPRALDSNSNVTAGVQASDAVASRPDHPPKSDPAGASHRASE